MVEIQEQESGDENPGRAQEEPQPQQRPRQTTGRGMYDILVVSRLYTVTYFYSLVGVQQRRPSLHTVQLVKDFDALVHGHLHFGHVGYH